MREALRTVRSSASSQEELPSVGLLIPAILSLELKTLLQQFLCYCGREFVEIRER